MPHKILILDGHGIGPEVREAARRVVTWFSDACDLGVSISGAPVGLSALAARGGRRSKPWMPF